MSILTQAQVEELRKIYANKTYKTTKEIYESLGFQSLIEYNSFREVFTGLRWG